MKKWRNLRDSFVKDLKASKHHNGTRSGKRRKYIFFNRLSFLSKSIEGKTRRQSTSDVDWSDSEEDGLQNCNSHEGDAIDPYKLIDAVKECPSIWDGLSIDYHDRAKTKISWFSICKSFYPQYEEMSEVERANILINIQKKWRNFRDCFVKDLKASKRCGNMKPLKRRKYIFFDRLSFLTRSVETKINASMSVGSPSELMDDEPLEQKYRPPEDPTEDYFQSAEETQFLQERVEDKLYPICDLSDTIRTGRPTDSTRSSSPDRKELWPLDTLPQSLLMDDDVAFFFSLLPAVKKFNEDTKFEFRMEIMKLVKKLKAEQLHLEHVSCQKPSTST